MEKNLQKFDERLSSNDRMTISFRLFFFSVLGWSHFVEKQFISMPNKNQQTIGSANTFNFYLNLWFSGRTCIALRYMEEYVV